VSYEWQPDPVSVAMIATKLDDYLHEPDKYWNLLVSLLHDQIVMATDQHREDCIDNRDCRTCMSLARIEVILEGHNLVQPDGCACPEHRVYPHWPALRLAEPHLN
jgi:hypothetical protein